MTFSTLFALFIATTLYAVVLARLGPSLDWTWATVVIGTTICLAAVAFQAISNPALWPGLIAACWAFAVGGAPMIVWQIRRSVTWRDVVIERIRKRYGRSKRMADESQAGGHECYGNRSGD